MANQMNSLASSVTGRVVCRSRQYQRSAFTLIELLIVVAIIGLLLSIGVPAGLKIYAQAKQKVSQSMIHQLDSACKTYHIDFDDYPPSDTHYGRNGGALLCLLLTGYADDGDDNFTPSGDLSSDDGKDGFGFRLAFRGVIYGPYHGADKINAGGTPPIFIDASGNRILYYRWDEDTSLYIDAHNSDGPIDGDDINTYAKDSSGNYYRRDFLLCTQGPNELWNMPNTGNSDDVTNFFD